MEEFRAIIADSVVLNLINNGMLTKADFLTWRDSCQLSDEGRGIFFEPTSSARAPKSRTRSSATA